MIYLGKIQRHSDTVCKYFGGELKQWINDIILPSLTLHHAFLIDLVWKMPQSSIQKFSSN